MMYGVVHQVYGAVSPDSVIFCSNVYRHEDPIIPIINSSGTKALIYWSNGGHLCNLRAKIFGFSKIDRTTGILLLVDTR